VPKTLLAVDDSATMRKALEITFGSDDFRVVTAETSASALTLLKEEPQAVVIDCSLGGGDDGYALARAVRSRDPRIALVGLSSRYNPYDAAKGRDAGFDDYADKPFDTQGLLDKVKKAIGAREGMKAAAPAPVLAPPAPAPHVAPAAAAAPFGSRAPAVPVASPAPPVVSAKPQQPWPTQRTHTLTFEGGMPPAAPPPAPAAAFAPPMSHVPQRAAAPAGLPIVTAKPAGVAAAPAAAARPAPAAAHMAPTAPPAAAVESAVNGQLAGKLGNLGLTPQQVDAVLALSREVVERVVWEVVPQLAETIIKEEITRLTKE
jgi:CheY-like chemotaxis protein